MLKRRLTTLKFGMFCVNACVDNVNAGSFASIAIIDVRSLAGLALGDSSESPCGIGLFYNARY